MEVQRFKKKVLPDDNEVNRTNIFLHTIKVSHHTVQCLEVLKLRKSILYIKVNFI